MDAAYKSVTSAARLLLSLARFPGTQVKFPRHIVLLTPLSLAAGLLIGVTSASAVDTHWTPVGFQRAGATNSPVWSIAVSPAHPTTLLEATQGHGVLRSTDAGATWTSVTPSLTDAWVVAFDPQNPQTAYAGTPAAGFFKSTDEGKTWIAEDSGLSNMDIRTVAAAAGLVVAGTAQGVFYSNDAAASWHALGLSGLSIASLALLPKPASPAAGGASPAASASPTPSASASGAAAPTTATSPVSIFAGADNGSGLGTYLGVARDLSGTWTPVKGGFPGDAVVVALASGSAPSGGTQPPVLAGTNQGLFRSDDGGVTWSAVGGLPTSDFNALAFNPANPDQIYVGSDMDQGNGGVWRSLDRGASWSPLGSGMPSNPRVTALALQPLNPLEVLAATWSPTTSVVATYKISDPSAAVAGAAPTASATAAPSVASTARAANPTVGPARRSSAPVAYEPYAAAGAVLLALIVVVLLRRWRMRREDRRTYRS